MSLNNRIVKAKKVLCFGCSFTRYAWSTWADLLKGKYKKIVNHGRAGAGNYYIFQKILEEYTTGNIDKQDLIMVCWTGIYRQDNKIRDNWHTHGNLLSGKHWPKNVVKDFFDPEFLLERDLYYIYAINRIFEKQIINFSISEFEQIIEYDPMKIKPSKTNIKIQETLNTFYPSFKQILGEGYWNQNKDPHPTTEQHKKYLEKVFEIIL